jgi:acyl carrier protein
MDNQTMSDVLQSIARSYCAAGAESVSTTERLESSDSRMKLTEAIREELGVVVTPEEVEASRSLSHLSTLVESRLTKNDSGKTLLDIYLEVEKLARDEYHPKIPYHWCAKWNDFFYVGNWLTRPDELDSVEIIIRIEQEYGIQISDEDAEAMETVGQTVRYLGEKTLSKSESWIAPKVDHRISQDSLARRLKRRLLQRLLF